MCVRAYAYKRIYNVTCLYSEIIQWRDHELIRSENPSCKVSHIVLCSLPHFNILLHLSACARNVARKESLDVHQKNWVCHIYCQINAQKIVKK